MCFEDGRRGYKPRDASGNKKLEKARKPVTPYNFQKECSSADINFSSVKLISDFL